MRQSTNSEPRRSSSSGSWGVSRSLAIQSACPCTKYAMPRLIKRLPNRDGTRNRVIEPEPCEDGSSSAHASGFYGGGSVPRYANDEATAAVLRELGPQLAAVQLDDLAGDVEPQANAAAVARVRPVEALEHSVPLLRRDAD